MMKKQLTFLLLILPFLASAQLDDDFSDGDFTSNPVWSGDDAFFEIESEQLNSKGPEATETIYLSTPSTRVNNTEWRFLIDLDFAPSGSNQVRVYLVADSPNLENDQNGYFLEIGQSGADLIKIFRQSGATSTEVYESTASFSGSVLVRIKLLRDNAGHWELYLDNTGGEDFSLDGTFTDNTYTSTDYFGVVCRFTSSRRDAFFFDDFYIGDEIIDTEAPNIQSLMPTSANTLEVLFSESVQEASAENTSNYVVNNGIGNPSSAIRSNTNLALVTLTFTNSFMSGVENILTVQNVQDLSENIMVASNQNFTFLQSFEPEFHELVITEIMADPTGEAAPLNPLPNAEFVELYNRSEKVLTLENTSFEDASSSVSLPTFTLSPGEYVIVCEEDNEADFQPFGNVLTVPSFPSLTNSGELLQIKSASGNLLFAVDYTDSWYQNVSKADGGWTLEMIDVDNPCAESQNWTASNAERGGTPASLNSVADSNPDLSAPILQRIDALDTQTIRLTFNEAMDKVSLENATYTVSNGIAVSSATPAEPFFKTVNLALSTELLDQQTYTITVIGLQDCNGNVSSNASLEFGLAQQGDALDIVLNEILFNPFPNGNDFVEIYNNSDKFIDLKDWKIANIADEIIANQKTISEDNFTLSPRSYLVLTEDALQLKSDYPEAVESSILVMDALPSYNDEAGTVILINNQSELMERFDYDEDFHFPLLDDDEGISLERTNFILPTNDRNSWHSAATNLRATPGYENSQSSQRPDLSEQVQISPRVFTPNSDGKADFTTFSYQFAQGGFVLTITIFDSRGREVKRLVQNQLLGTAEGSVTWDGIADDGTLAKMGYYLALVKVLDTSGNTQTFKKTLVVGRQF